MMSSSLLAAGPLKHGAVIPLYEQVAEVLRRQIHTSELKPGMAIPSESELTSSFKVSRVTARKALDLLVSEGLIVRRQGKGTFVISGKIQQDLQTLRGFAELMAERGDEQAMEVIEFGVVEADARVARALRLDHGSSVLRVAGGTCCRARRSPTRSSTSRTTSGAGSPGTTWRRFPSTRCSRPVRKSTSGARRR
jgi:DNA-binding transcriptional regulator YhcF (GntR family)